MPDKDDSILDSDATLDHLKSVDVEKAFGAQFVGRSNRNVYCPHCEDPKSSKSKSCSVSRIGVYSCKTCKAQGTAAEFYAQRKSLTHAQALLELASDTPESPEAAAQRAKAKEEKSSRLSWDMVNMCESYLHDVSQHFLHYLHEERGLTAETLLKHHIGADEQRITIPIIDKDGNVCNIRRYLPNAERFPKILSHELGVGQPALYPLSVLDSLEPGDELILCEGEWDALLLNQMGFRAITNTGSVSTWNDAWNELLRPYKIVIIFDVNDKEDSLGMSDLGQRQARLRARELRSADLDVKVARLPLPDSYVGGDVTDWFMKARRDASSLRRAIDEAASEIPDEPPLSAKDPPSHADPLPDGSKPLETADLNERQQGLFEDAEEVTLGDAASSSYYFKPIRMRCQVAGKGASPYIIPNIAMVEIKDPEGQIRVDQVAIDIVQGEFLQLVGTSDKALGTLIRKKLKIPNRCSLQVEVLETFNVEEVHLIPAVDDDSTHLGYTMRRCYYVGRGLETNRVYEFTGYTMPEPKSQQATHILLNATPAESTVESFTLDPETYESLRETFQTNDVYTKMEDIADDAASHITRIYGRRDLHIAVDLVFHSVLSFDFGGARVRKGWLECLILGDTRTGKGCVTEGLVRHYGIGDIVSGENLTLAGLVGGVQRIDDRWALVWGKLPLCDRRLIVLDECGSLTHNDIGKLSRIRSEGIAEITKVVSEKTTARTRLIWIANPRPNALSNGDTTPKMLSEFNHGIEAVPELVGAAEDVARFDYALIVAQSEVSSSVINKRHEVNGSCKYPSHLCKKLIMWAWSRSPEQIIFEEKTVDLAFKAAQDLGRQFTPKICLIQSEDVRFKLARIACAAAAHTFSTPDGELLVIKPEHIEFAYNFLFDIYSKGCAGYSQLSAIEKERRYLRDETIVRDALDSAGDHTTDLVSGLLDHRAITARDMCDYGGMDIHQARALISEFVRHRALVKEHNNYAKTEAFKTFLRRVKAELIEENYVTQAEAEEQNNG
jgi:hypothetical protein